MMIVTTKLEKAFREVVVVYFKRLSNLEKPTRIAEI
jgi:hypothetical protein